MAKQKVTKEQREFIQPSIKIEGDEHPFESMMKNGEMPILKAIGYTKLGEGRHSWVNYTITFQGDKILKIDVETPNLRQIAEESAKIAFVTEFIDKEIQ